MVKHKNQATCHLSPGEGDIGHINRIEGKGMKSKAEIILKVGAAGGSLTLFGIKSPDGQWKFFQERNETAAYDLLSEEDREGLTPVSRTPYMHSIENALLSLEQYPWFKLFPMKVHPEFLDEILEEVKRLGVKSEIQRWREHLTRPLVLKRSLKE
jgi:hypothetical protein